jgi:hypothetical protein
LVAWLAGAWLPELVLQLRLSWQEGLWLPPSPATILKLTKKWLQVQALVQVLQVQLQQFLPQALLAASLPQVLPLG